jgi:WD40 repeat protein
VGSMSFSPDGKKLACGTYNDTRVYDVDSGTLVLGPLKFYKDYGCFVLWSRDGSRLFSASSKTIRCWNSDTAEQIGQPWTGHTRHILSLSLSPDGSILASASLDKTVRFWDTTSGHPIAQHLQHDGGVGAVHFSPSGEFVASTVWDEKTYLWRAPWLTSAENTMVMTLLEYFTIHTHYPLHPRQALLTLTRTHRATPYNARKCTFSHLHHTLSTFLLLNKCRISISV